MSYKVKNKSAGLQLLSSNAQGGGYSNPIKIPAGGEVLLSDEVFGNLKLNPSIFESTHVDESFDELRIGTLETQAKGDATVLRVSKTPSKGVFTSIGAALASITDSSPVKPYEIQVGPGIFEEATIDLNAKPFVSLQGEGERATIIKPASPSQQIVLKMSGTCEVSDLTINGNGTAAYAIHSLDIGNPVGYPAGFLSRLVLVNAGTLIYHKNTVASPYGSILRIEEVEFNGGYSEGLFVEPDAAAQWSGVIVQNLLAYTNAPANVLHTKGTWNAVIKAIGPCTVEDYSGGNSVGVKMEGGYVELSNMTALFFGKAISIANSADVPDMKMTNTKMLACGVDFENLHASATGTFSGVAAKGKVTNPSSTLTMSYQDPDTHRQVASAAKWDLSGGMLPTAVAAIPTPGSATAEDVANKVNDVIAALKAAGLMAV